MQAKIVTPGNTASEAVLSDDEVRVRYKEQIQELGKLSAKILRMAKQIEDLEQEKNLTSLDHLAEREKRITQLGSLLEDAGKQELIHVQMIDFLKNTLAQMIDETDNVYPIKDKGSFDPVQIIANLVEELKFYRENLIGLNGDYPIEDMDKCDLVDVVNELKKVATNALDKEKSTGRSEELDGLGEE